MNKKTLFLVIFTAVLTMPFLAQADQFCDMVSTAKGIALKVGATLVVIGWVIAGILYLTSGGGEKMSVAKKALVAAVAGTVIILVADTAINLVGDAISQTNSGGECNTTLHVGSIA